MSVLSDSQLASIARAAGFTGPDLITAVAVCLAESGGQTDAVSTTLDYGLWQIHASAWPNLMTPLVMTQSAWKQPAVNAGYAYHIWKWGGWTPWSTYKSGSYQHYMARATVAVEGGIMPTKADKVLEYWKLIRYFPYMRGWESSPDGPDAKYDVGEPLNPSKQGDCSGDVWASWIYAGITLNGKPITKADRHTADTYWHMATVKLAQPQHPGDLGFHVDSKGHAYHVFEYLSLSQVGEMGDGTGRADIHTLAQENARGAKWGRIPGMDFGELTPPGPTPSPTPAPYVDWPELIKNPYQGPHVKVLKIWLNAVMGSKLDVNNDRYGPSTAAVVKTFQQRTWPKDKKQWDGVVGDKTQAALYKAFVAL